MQAEDVAAAPLPALEALGAGLPGVAARAVAGGRVQVDDGGVEVRQGFAADPQEAGAARAAQELAAGTGEQVAADLGHVDRELAHRLGGVQQERHARRPGDPADLGGRVDQAAAGGDMADADEPGAFVDQCGQGPGVQLAGGVVGHDDDPDAEPLGGLEVGQQVAGVLGAAGQDPVAGPEAERVEGGVPGVGAVVEQRHLLGPAAEQGGEPGVGPGEPLGGLVGGRVAADGRLQGEVVGHRRQGLAGEQPGARVVEVDAVRAARGLPAQRVEVHGCDSPLVPVGLSNMPVRGSRGERRTAKNSLRKSLCEESCVV